MTEREHEEMPYLYRSVCHAPCAMAEGPYALLTCLPLSSETLEFGRIKGKASRQAVAARAVEAFLSTTDPP